MKSLKTLIKLQKTFVDEQRQHLARLLENLEAIEGRIAQHEIVRVREQEAAKNQAMRATYGAFIKGMIAKSRELEKERQGAAMAVQKAQDRLSELFEEQKRYEIAEEQRLAEEAREENHRERINLDEIGGMMHERKRSE